MPDPQPVGEILIDDSLKLSELLKIPVTVLMIKGDRWAFLAEQVTGHA